MNRKLAYLLLGLALLILPAASRAMPSSTPAFSGPPDGFTAIDANTFKAYLRLNLAKGGKFTGILDFTGGTHNVIRGTLSASGSFSGTASPSQTPYILVITGSTPSTYFLTGSAGGLFLTGLPLAYMKGQTLSDAGMYTAAMEATGTGNVPGGYGYGRLHIGNTGASTFAGKLPDGTSFTAAGSLLAEGTSAQILILEDRSLYNRKGTFLGYIDLNSQGMFIWQKPPGKGAYYPAGFNVGIEAVSYKFTKTSENAFTSGTIAFAGGMLANSGTSAGFTVSNKHFVFNPPNPLNVKLSINELGAVKGSFAFPQMISGKTVPVKYSGMLIQQGTNVIAFGYFLSPIISGSGSVGNFEVVP